MVLQPGQEPLLKRKKIVLALSFDELGTHLFEKAVEAFIELLRDRVKMRPPY